ncbi:MAG: inositol monophosphatase family protein [Pelovirga sp.]
MTDTSLLSAVIELSRTVGNYQLEQFRQSSPGSGKEKEEREFVSAVDTNSEEMLKEGLLRLLPEAGFYGEETGQDGSVRLRWVIDPIDGTTNFLSGLDQFCISIALEQDQHSELGVIRRPASGECFSAIRGRGMYHQESLCRKVIHLPLQQALIGTGFPYRSADLAEPFFACAKDILYRCRGIRRFGSAALDLCYVAAGFLQGFWESDLKPYDVAAALLFLEETGCIVTNDQGAPYSPYRDRLLICGFPGVHEELLPLVKNHYQS